MAAILTIFSSGKPVDLFYVVKEPKFEETINSYLNGNGCSATYVYVSKEPAKSKFKIQFIFNSLINEIPNLQKPVNPMAMIDLLQEMMSRDYINTACLTPEDRKNLKRKSKPTESPDTTTDAAPTSPMFEGSFDDETLLEISRMEFSKSDLDQSLLNFPVLEAIDKLANKLDAQMNLTKEILNDVLVIRKELNEVQQVQAHQSSALGSILTHLKIQKICVFCATGDHAEVNCIWSLLKCSTCQVIGHNPKVHEAKDPELRERIMKTHGTNLSFFKT